MTGVQTRAEKRFAGTPEPGGPPSRRRFRGLALHRFRGILPRRLVAYHRPIWYMEVLILLVGYYLYSLGRNAIPDEYRVAVGHARQVQSLQNSLHISFELGLNQWAAAHEWFAQICDYDYATLHFIVTPVVIVWLFWKRAAIYRSVRTVLVIVTLLALLGFAVFPTAPPRLLHGLGYVDTVDKFHTWGSLSDPSIAAHSNQFAAMPSLHVAWALWCGCAIVMCARRTWLKILGALYPVTTTVVVFASANHFELDAIAGAFIVALAFGIQYLLSGHGAFTASPGSPEPKAAPTHGPATAITTDLRGWR